MNISLIAAVGKNLVIGKDNAMPWHLPADLKYFKRVTLGKHVIMGRKTFASIGRPLPGRTNIIVTRDADYRAEGCVVVRSIGQALQAAEGAGEVMVIGGANLFEQLLPSATRIYLTEIKADFAGDSYFPALRTSDWRERERQDYPADDANPYPYSFVVMERVKPTA
ncbi:MAG: type 3 dihydrofolate reductase [Gammaproteobacteria bacterium]